MIRLRWSLMTAEKLLKATAVSGRRYPAAPDRSRARPTDGSAPTRRSATQAPRDGAVPAQRLDSVLRAGWAVAAVRAEHGRDQPAIGGHQTDQRRRRRGSSPPTLEPPTDLLEGAGKIVPQLRERAGQRRRARDHDIVRTGSRRPGQRQPQRLAQAPAGAVAHHGAADLAGDGKADADRGASRSGRGRPCSANASRDCRTPRAAARNSLR